MDSRKKKQGFATFTPDKLKAVSSKGGQKRIKTKGFGHLSPEERSANASKASLERWRRVKEARENGSRLTET